MNIASHRKRKHTERGFTMVELMVTLGIVVLVTGVIMLRYAAFNSSVLLNGQTYIAAFDLREAQSLAISVKGQGSEFREEYGIYYDITTPNSYELFQDDAANGDHNPARFHSDEAVGAGFKVDPRFEIVNICATNSSTRTCYVNDPETSGEVVDTNLSDIAISFKRPDFNAAFYSSAKSNITSAEIIFGPDNDLGVTKKVVVYESGQIAVE